ncbi:hypothetical protein KAW38_03430 [Candidatus Micrarchaeota archaeon]|nr:hypothetical protein [Candidatus Micrarchaeota archaeon]
MRSWWLFLFLLPVVFSITIDLPKLDNTFVMLVGMLSVLVIVMYSIVASFTQNPRYMAYFKIELQEFITSIIIVAIAMAFFTGADATVQMFSNEDNSVELAEAVTESILEDIGKVYTKIAEAYNYVGIATGFSHSYTVANAFYIYTAKTEMPFSGLSPLMGSLQSAASQLTMQYFAFYALKLVAGFISAVVPTFVLPVGFALRIFPFTRKLGSTLIAISAGALVFFPLSLVFIGEIYNQIDFSNVEEAKAFHTEKLEIDQYNFVLDVSKAICGNVFLRTLFSIGDIAFSLITSLTICAISCIGAAVLYGVCFAGCFFPLFDLMLWSVWPLINFGFMSAYSAATAIFGSLDYSAAVSQMEPVIKILVPAAAELSVFTIFSMIFIGIITITGTRAVSSALGGEQILYGISKIL